MMIASFVFFLLIFVAIGAWSVVASKRTTADYLTAGQSIKPWLVALSAVATNNSGYMFTGMIGFTYVNGLSSIWLMIGWILGDFIGSITLWRAIRDTTEKRDLHSFSGLVTRWWGQHYRRLRALSGVLILLFLGTYAGAQLNAGSKALHVALDWDLATGAWIGAIIVLIYSFAGGIRASIWTDAAQSVVMVVAMPLMMWMAVQEVGGWRAMMEGLHSVEGGFMNWFQPDSTVWSALLFVVGWFFAGFGVVGQPHVMVRYMSLTDASLMNQVRAYYYGWFLLWGHHHCRDVVAPDHYRSGRVRQRAGATDNGGGVDARDSRRGGPGRAVRRDHVHRRLTGAELLGGHLPGPALRPAARLPANKIGDAAGDRYCVDTGPVRQRQRL